MEGFLLADLQRQWPLATKAPKFQTRKSHGFVLGGVAFGEIMDNCDLVRFGTFLKDGRFALLMKRYWGDLRSLINLKLGYNNSQGPPFLLPQAVWIMMSIAAGMKELHERGVLHRDLKAANVLVWNDDDMDLQNDKCIYCCFVADFESLMLLQGTGFWRAPEVLKELLKKPCDQNKKIWTQKVDAYSYAMTCYEVLTGHIPFFGYDKRDWKRVIDGERPHLPGCVDARLQEIVERCWHKEPLERPTFEVIVENMWEELSRQVM